MADETQHYPAPSFPAFDPQREKWTSYSGRLEFHLEAHGIKEALRKKAILLSSVGPTTYDLLQALMAPALLTDVGTTYDKLVKTLDSHYDETKFILTGTYQFYTCHQKPSQSLSDWLAELRNKARPCAFSTSTLAAKPLERALRDMLVIGTSSPKVRQALFKEGDIGLEDALKIARSIEQVEREVVNFNSSSHQPATINKIQKPPFSKNSRTSYKQHQHSSAGQKSTSTCLSCGSSSHDRNQCRFLDAECSYRHKKGHIEQACITKKKKEGSFNKEW